ncbi:hypothetical protein ACFQY8_03320 [Alloscardovia venturai]|uniref:Uncharacterized protein n=1 Tax=Alloscardovia venturai TaxID=1769421 RepID=A0ABW2Y4X2_9BIFI
MSKTDNDNTSLLIACIQWTQAECNRLVYGKEHYPSSTRISRLLLAKPSGIDIQKVNTLFNDAIKELNKENFDSALNYLQIIRELVDKPIRGIIFGGETYNKRFNLLVRLLRCEAQGQDCRRELEALWFDMAHSYREKGSVGVPSIPDISQFMIVETIATIALIIIGIIIPTINSPGLSKIIPTLVFLVIGAIATCAVFVRVYLWRYTIVIATCFPVLPFIFYLQTISSYWVVGSWTGGFIVGTLVANHIAYKRSRRMANKYGPLACLWVRHVKRNTFELLMVKTDGSLAWHWISKGIFRITDPALSCAISIDYRGNMKFKGYSTSYRPDEGWFPCYPALVSTRMKGLQRWNPKDLEDAIRLTPELTPHMREEFFNHAPSIVTPPQEYVNTPATHIPRFTPIPW